MTAYDDWKTTKQEIDDEAWNESVGQVAYDLNGRTNDLEEFVSIIANSDDVLTWLSHAVKVPQHHLHDFRYLIKLASGLRKEVETEMKANRSYPDAD